MQTLSSPEFRRGHNYPARMITSVLLTVCFAGALATDVAYLETSTIQWANFSAWLLAIGMALGVISIIVELVSILWNHRPLGAAHGWVHLGLIVIALAVALVNNFVHARDGWTSVVPTGLILSAITVLILIAAIVMGCISGYRDRMGAFA